VTQVGVIDLEIGNIKAIRSSLRVLGVDSTAVQTPEQIPSFSHLLLPGVGSFVEPSEKLHESGWTEALHASANRGQPILGICLGMQLLGLSSSEGGESAGLGLVNGQTSLLPQSKTARVPHVGWNSVHQRREHPLYEGIPNHTDFYFSHSFAMKLTESGEMLGTTEHGEDFISVVGRGSTLGIQFHPERSQRAGLRLLLNFVNWKP